jgi:hypothetical protein
MSRGAAAESGRGELQQYVEYEHSDDLEEEEQEDGEIDAIAEAVWGGLAEDASWGGGVVALLFIGYSFVTRFFGTYHDK